MNQTILEILAEKFSTGQASQLCVNQAMQGRDDMQVAEFLSNCPQGIADGLKSLGFAFEFNRDTLTLNLSLNDPVGSKLIMAVANQFNGVDL